jgi:hypothetical protein
MQKLHDRKNVGKIILDPSLQPKPRVNPNTIEISLSLNPQPNIILGFQLSYDGCH